MAGLKIYILVNVDEERSTVPLAAYCVMAGVINALLFSVTSIWFDSQTGKLSLALAGRLEHNHTFQLVDRQALCSLIAVMFTIFLGSRVGDKIGCKTRAWLFLGTLIQVLFTAASAILIRESSVTDARNNLAWSDTPSLIFTGPECELGPAGYHVSLTTTLCEFMADPKLLDVRRVASREYRILTIVYIFFGTVVGHLLLDKNGFTKTLGIAAGIRLAISVWWLFAPVNPRM
ncbi:hypothetical protein EDB19DRAFT_1892963 [Suillus lakei]|nr:hypothetical protein EDB19DRAFT_1892963 [Suillus lakei]